MAPATHPIDPLTTDAPAQITAAAMLLQEGVEGDE
jgi:hypothetical protein